jgi:hypothetical protein
MNLLKLLIKEIKIQDMLEMVLSLSKFSTLTFDAFWGHYTSYFRPSGGQRSTNPYVGHV